MFFPIEYDNIAIYVHLIFLLPILKFIFGLKSMQIIRNCIFYFSGNFKNGSN